LQISTSRAKFLGRSLELSVSEDMLGRVFDGMGRPRDGSAPVIADKRMDVNGEPLNPAVLQAYEAKLEQMAERGSVRRASISDQLKAGKAAAEQAKAERSPKEKTSRGAER